MHEDNIKIEDRILLVKAARYGCSKSLAEVYIKFKPAVCDFLRKRGADGTAEDICQSVFIEIYEGKCMYDGTSEAKTFLFGIANNLLKSHLRKAAKGIDCFPLDHIHSESTSQDNTDVNHQRLQTAEIQEFLTNIIAELPPKSAQALKMVFLDGITPVNAAGMIGLDLKVFCGRLDYGLRKLKKNKKSCKLKSLFCNMLCLPLNIF